MSEHKVYQALSNTTRVQILKILHREHQDVEDLAKKLKLRPVTTRHHLQSLQEAGLLETFEERSGTAGRPKTYYKIAKSVPSIVYPPRRYMIFSALLIDQLLQVMGKSRAIEILGELGRKMGKETVEEVERGFRISKWTPNEFEEVFVKEYLEAAGNEPEVVDRSERQIVVRLHNCIFFELSQRMPELMCDVAHRKLFDAVGEAMGGIKVSQTYCMGHGDHSCEHIFEWSNVKKGQ